MMKSDRVVKRFSVLSLALAGLLSLFSAPALQAAPGDLLVSPARIVFEGRDRSAEITLINKGEEKAVFRVTLEERRMLVDGAFENAEEALPGERSAAKLIRYAPRRIALDPNKPQTIRLLLRKPKNIEAGEYRSHLLFRATPDSDAQLSVEQLDSEAENIAIRLIPIYGVTIPVIVREGQLEARLQIESVEFVEAGILGERPHLVFSLLREGSRSVFGDLTVNLVGAAQEDPPLGKVRGVAVYTPNNKRRVAVPIEPEAANSLRGKPVVVSFEDTNKNKRDLMAEARFTVQ